MILDMALALLTVCCWTLCFLFPKFWSLGWVVLAPFLLILRDGSFKRVFIVSLITGYLSAYATAFWTLDVEGMTFLNLLLAALVYGLYIALFGVLARLLYKYSPNWSTLTVPGLWVVVEFVRTHADFLSWPFGLIGYTQYPNLTVSGLSAYTGIYGVSFLLACSGALLAELTAPAYGRLRRRLTGEKILVTASNTRALKAGGAAMLVLLALMVMPRESKADESSVRVSVVQGGIYWLTTQDQSKMQAVYDRYLALSRQAAQANEPAIIIWPSASVPGMIPADKELVWDLGRLARKQNVHLLVGSIGMDKFREGAPEADRYSNVAFHFANNGLIAGRYDKMRLLPFDEYIPLRKYISWPSWIVRPIKDSKPGEKRTVFDIKKAKFSTLICWENYFPEQFREMAAQGADFMVSMTNDAFTESHTGHRLMFVMNLFRAIENGIPIVRASTTGISAIVGPRGDVLASVKDEKGREIDIFGHASADIPLSSARSFYFRYGNVFMYGLLIMVSFSMLHALMMEFFNRKSLQT